MVISIASPLGNRIVALRKERDLSQKELAAAARVPREWLSTLETGEVASPGAARLERVADALHTTTRYLLTGERSTDDDALDRRFKSYPPSLKQMALDAV